MAARPLQPSEYEIQREVEALKDLRRRSTNPGALTLDPDLPIPSGPGSPTSPYRQFNTSSSSQDDDNHDASAHPGGVSLVNVEAQGSSAQDEDDSPTDDPFHLFWVPASKHPELAPGEFRAFLKEHARVPSNDEGANLARSMSSSSLSRKKSMLSRPYKPRENDGVEDESIVPIKRNRSVYRHDGPQLTISDLQKLDELAEEASQSDDPSKLRSVLRRSLSMNLSPTAILLDELPDMGDEADAPIIIPSRDKALRRTARTKIRKPGLPGDGGGHRFAASRRGKTSQLPVEPRTSSDLSSSDHGELDSSLSIGRRSALSDEGSHRPESYSEETSIYEAYAGGDDEEDDHAFQPILTPSRPPELLPTPNGLPATAPIVEQPPHPEGPPTIIHQPQPQRLIVPESSRDQTPSRTPSPPSSEQHASAPAAPPSPSIPPVFVPISTPPASKKDKDKKGLFKWGGGKKETKTETQPRASEKESGFLFNLFGSKKKQDSEYQSSITGGASGREAAQALLGASKSSKSYVPPTSPGLAPGIGGNPYARYPIHVERAIYRLSHIKLANPRRPLYEQVLISNLMFWYLGIINKAQNPPVQAGANGTASENPDAEKEEREKREKEEKEKEKAAKEKQEKERLEKEQKERELEIKKKESNKRGSLTKTPTSGPPGGRRAETPVRGPQYEMQHRVMEQEYGGYGMQQPRSPTTQSPPVPMNGAGGGTPNRQQRPPQPMPGQPMPPLHMQPLPPSQLMQQGSHHMHVGVGQLMPMQHMSPGPVMQGQPIHSPHQQPNQYYYQPPPDGYNASQRPGLPPGAMAPIEQQQQNWMAPLPSPQRRNPSPNPADRRSQSPPSQGPYSQPLHKMSSQEHLGERNGYRSPGRSLSASAPSVPPSPPNGVLRKGNSAHAAINHVQRPRTAEGRTPAEQDEDVPLAVWQQQRRK